MGAITKVGVLFAEPQCRPLSTASMFQSGCYLVFTSGGVMGPLAPVYRDPALMWPFTQTTIPGSGPPPQSSVVSGIPSDGTGLFPPIYLNPAIAYSYSLYASDGTLLEQGTYINVPNTQQALMAQKISTTSRSATTVLANDPDLQIAINSLNPGLYRVEMDLTFVSLGGGSTMSFTVAYSGTLNAAEAANALTLYGTMNNVNTVSEELINVASGSFSVGTNPAQNSIRLVGIMAISTVGTLSLKWAQNVSSNNPTSLCVGSAMYVTPL